MSKLRKAAQELIAASESCDIDQGTGSWASDDAWSALVDALEDALAQPEQEIAQAIEAEREVVWQRIDAEATSWRYNRYKDRTWERDMYNDKDLDIVNVLRMYADDLHSVGGFNGYARAMSLAADEIVKLRDHAKAMEEDLVATIEQRDELGADKATWFRMSEIFCQQAAEYKKQVENMSLGRAFK